MDGLSAIMIIIIIILLLLIMMMMMMMMMTIIIIMIVIVSITKFSIVIGSPRTYLPRNRLADHVDVQLQVSDLNFL